jgi:carboxypeptidase T
MITSMGRSMRRLLFAGLAAWLVLASGPVPATAFPAGDEGYHDYAELTAEIHAIAASRPDIVALFSIGTSYEGRELWTAKVSADPYVDAHRPEILIDGGHHAREHGSVELALYLLQMLADGHGSDPRITAVVEASEIYIVFNLNPDGIEFDHTSGTYQEWRKNRQPVADGAQLGLDLNRTYGYNWGCCGGGSDDPSHEQYRGTGPWQAPEVVALRDFVDSRVVGGEQQIRMHATLHQYGQLVLWPWGFTAEPDLFLMPADDHALFTAMGQAMAAASGYLPLQSGALYINDGNQMDWLYAEHRIFTFTFELGPDRYLPYAQLGAELDRNREALLYLMEAAGCPQEVIGLASAYCQAEAYARQLHTPAARARLAAGDHVAYRFDRYGDVLEERAVSLSSRRDVRVAESARILGRTGRWLRIASGTLAGYWIEQGSAIRLLAPRRLPG